MTPAETYAQKCLEAVELIRQHAPPRLQDALIALLRPAIALSATRADDAQIPLGASKFGGAPDVPPGFEWPMWNDKPLGFLAQINLEEVAPFDVEELLPKSGLLSFFFSWEDWSGTGEDLCRILWLDSSSLSRANSKGESQIDVPCATISAELYFDLQLINPLENGLTNKDDLEHLETLFRLPYGPLSSFPLPDSFNGHKMLGYCDDLGYGVPASSPSCHSLLQLFLGEFPVDKVDFGAAVALYFSISPADLRERRFYKAQFEVSAS